MPPLTTLPSDLWFAIAEYLTVGDLFALYETFVGEFVFADVQTISMARANTLLYKFFTTSPMMVQYYVKSNANGLPLPCPQKRTFSPYMHSPVKGDRCFASISESKVKLTITMSDLKNGVTPYHSSFFGQEPLEIWYVKVALHPDSYVLRSNESQHLELCFHNRDPPGYHQVKVEHHQPTFSTRTLTQNLHLGQAYWVSQRGEQNRELPASCFSFLGNCIHATATFTKRDSTMNPHSSPRHWIASTSYFKSASMSFDDFALPSSKSLLRFLPPQVIIQRSGDQDN